jgi:hypothetical protein
MNVKGGYSNHSALYVSSSLLLRTCDITLGSTYDSENLCVPAFIPVEYLQEFTTEKSFTEGHSFVFFVSV